MKTIFAILLISTFWISTISTIVYEALKSDSLETVESALTSLNAENANSLNNAYAGALTMKKAGFIKVPAKKVKIFKQGHQLLEGEIAAHPNNIEYRFLRLAVQENAPKILKYDQNIDEDKAMILANYKGLNPQLKKHIQEYSMNSLILKTSDLKD